MPTCEPLLAYAARVRERDAYKVAKEIDTALIAAQGQQK